MWMSKVRTHGETPQQLGGSSGSYATTVANTESSASLPGTQPITPLKDGLSYRRPDVEADDDAYRNALVNLPKRSQRVPS